MQSFLVSLSNCKGAILNECILNELIFSDSSMASTILTPRRFRKKKRKLQKSPEDVNKVDNSINMPLQKNLQDYEKLFRSLFQEEINKPRQAKLR